MRPSMTLEIASSREIDGQTFYELRGFRDRSWWLRRDDEGRIWSWEDGAERLWYAFETPEGDVYQTALPSCCGRAMVTSKKARYGGGLGEFNNMLEQRYPGVFQVGIDRELFLPYVGMVHRTENIGGPAIATYDLIYARLGDTFVAAAPEQGFTLSLANGRLARLALRHTTGEPLRLNFPSGQSFDVVIRDAAGEEFYRWSTGKGFTLALRSVDIEGERQWAVELPEWPAGGGYTLEAWLTTIGARRYSALLPLP